MVRKFAWDPEHWRFRAEEARTVADAPGPLARAQRDFQHVVKLEAACVAESAPRCAISSGHTAEIYEKVSALCASRVEATSRHANCKLSSADYSWRRGFFGGERGLKRPAHV